MDVNTISNAAVQNFNQFITNKNASAAKSAYGTYATTAKQDTTANTLGDAFAVDISDEAKQAAAQDSETVDDATSKATKGLTDEQVQALKDDLELQQQTMLNLMIQVLTSSNNKLQGWLDEGTGILNFGGVQVDASRFALPSVATNPEDAAKAVADGGEWSVGAVSDRIFGLAEIFAGGDPEKLQEMRDAVEEGFKQAGMVWKDTTGESNMPEITQKTYGNIMNRFEEAMSQFSA